MMNRLLKILVCGFFLIVVAPSWAIMSGDPVGVMKEDMEHNNGQLGLEANIIFESDISPAVSSNTQTESGEWYLVKGTSNINDFMDLYVRLGVSRLEHNDSIQSIKEKLEWAFAFGGGIMAELYEYEPWGFKLILDCQYYGTFPDIKSVRIGSTTYTSDIHSVSYKENNIQASLLSQMKLGQLFPYIGVTLAYRDITNKFNINSTDYNLSGENKNKVGLTAGFDFPFSWEELVSGTGILTIEGRFFDELGVNVALTNRF